MNRLDIYYKALTEYRRVTEGSRECEKSRRVIAETDADKDRIVVSRNVCTVDEEWVSAIEKGLVHIEKAIKEERQFIYSNGEVVPIEKVKNVSRETVVHLSKHSNYITQVTDGEDIVPDRLYTVERLNDYAVYENRFLYMLLCYLRDFVTVRYDKLLELTNRYEGSLKIEKSVTVAKQTLSYKVTLDETHLDDEYLRENNEAKPIIDRIDLILKTIVAFLATPLMEYAAKAAMLKPPITKTNVLKMDNNFKGAVALYDFIISYDKDGYTCEKKMVEISPFEEELALGMSEAGLMMAFLTYQYGLNLNDELKRRYEVEEARVKSEELKKRAEQLEALKRRIKNSDGDIAEYTLELEKYLSALRAELARGESLIEEVAQLRESGARLNKTVDELIKEISEGERMHAECIEALETEHKKQMSDLVRSNDELISNMEKQNEDKLEAMRANYNQAEEKSREQLMATEQKLSDANQRIKELLAERERMTDDMRLIDAQLKALRFENGLITKDESFTDKASFDELEKEFELFRKFYEQEWKKAKKEIRKNSFTWKNFKGQGKKD